MSTSSYPSSIDGNVVRRLRQDIAFVEVEEDEEHGVTVRMASKQHPLCNFVDEDDEIELYVTFTQQVRGVPWNNRASSSREETDDPSQYAIQVRTKL